MKNIKFNEKNGRQMTIAQFGVPNTLSVCFIRFLIKPILKRSNFETLPKKKIPPEFYSDGTFIIGVDRLPFESEQDR